MSCQAYFNQASGTYDQHASVQRETADLLFSRLVEANHFLEIGGGTGDLALRILSRYPQASYVLNDLSPEMLAVARSKLAAFEQVKFVCKNAEAVFWDAEVIVANMCLHWIQRLDRFLPKLWGQCHKQFLFSLPISGTFDHWYDFLCSHNVYYRFPFLSYETVERIVRDMGGTSRIDFVHYDLGDMTVRNFLQYMKALGIHAPMQEPAVDLRPVVPHADRVIRVRYDVVVVQVLR